MKLLSRVDSVACFVAWLALILAGIDLVGCALMTTGDVLSRWLFNRPWGITFDVLEAAFVGMIVLTFAQVEVRKRNIRIDFVVSRFKGKAARISEVAISIVSTIFLALVLWWGWEIWVAALQSGERTMGAYIEVPKSIFWGQLLLGAFLATMVTIRSTIMNILGASAR